MSGSVRCSNISYATAAHATQAIGLLQQIKDMLALAVKHNVKSWYFA